MNLSGRLPPLVQPNTLTRLLSTLQASGTPVIDLTESNPTHVGLPYPGDLLTGLASPSASRYDPEPLGLEVSRQAVAADYQRRGAIVQPEHIVLSASSSEMYSWLFKLLCNPGDRVLAPQPSYPLFEHLARLEGVELSTYPLEYHSRWEIDLSRLKDAPDDVRALLLVSPNNPTGSFVSQRELESVVEICRRRGWALIADEVFADYPVDDKVPLTDIAARADVLSFSLGGLSKSVGLPQLKLGWTLVGGPASERDQALAGLELIADTFLSVSTPVQCALPELFLRGQPIRAAIRERVRHNLAQMRRTALDYPACSVLPVEGGWSAVVRVPATRDEEAFALALLEEERVLVHPGYFFDFPHEAFIVVSLLPMADPFADAFERTLRLAS